MKIIYKTNKNYRNAKSFLFGLKGLSTYENEITLEEVKNLKDKELFLAIDKNIFDSDLEYLENSLKIIDNFNIKGILFKIIDTAGIRKADNEIEQIGIDKSKKALREADLKIAILDITKEISKEDLEILECIKNKNSIILLNKTDLKDNKINKEELYKYSKKIIEVSIKNNEGIEKIYDEMAEMFNLNEISTENTSIITNIRHKEAIKAAKNSINKVLEVIKDGMPTDITAIYFKESIEEINKITGENVTDDIINEIFAKFCLGK